MSSIKVQFGSRLRQLRIARNITQLQLAEACGVSVESISNIERGKHGPRLELISDLAFSLSVPVSELFQFDN